MDPVALATATGWTSGVNAWATLLALGLVARFTDAPVVPESFGGTTLASHTVKSGLRLAVNASPEPVSNVVVGTAEDVGVFGIVGLAVALPVLAAALVLLLLAVGVSLLVLAWRTVRRAFSLRRADARPTP